MRTAADIPARRTQASRRDDAARALLDAAAVLFARRGIDKTSLADIGEAAGYSRGLANHHFGSKAALIEQLIRRSQERFAHTFDRPARSTARKTIEAITDSYLARFEHPSPESRAFLVMWGASFPAESPVGTILAADQRFRDEIERFVRAGQTERSISERVDPEAFAVVLVGLIRGVAAVLLTNPDAVDVAAVRKQTRQLINAWLNPKEK